MRRWSFAGLFAVAVLATGPASAGGLPHIVSASSKQRHLVISAQFGDLVPMTVRAAVRPATVNGALARQNIVYSARLESPKSATGKLIWRSPGKLKRGTYWVQMTAVPTDVTDCPPRQRDCNTKYSNVRKVAIRK